MLLLTIIKRLAFAYLCIMAFMVLMQRQLMYYPSKNMLLPEDYGLDFITEYHIVSEDGTPIIYWYAAAKPGMPTIVYFHGNGANLGQRVHVLEQWHARGYGIAALSYRGYGRSGGKPSEKGLYADARSLLRELEEKHHVKPEQTIVHGESLGTGVAIEMARGKKYRALTLESPFTSTVAIAEKTYWWLPVRLLMWDRFESIEKVHEITIPMLVVAGRQDTIVPYENSRKLFDAMTGDKHFLTFEHYNHNDFTAEDIATFISDFDHNQR